MRICLVSQDRRTKQLFRETAAEFPGDNCQFSFTKPNSKPEPADLYLWDFGPSSHMPEVPPVGSEAKFAFLVHPDHLVTLHRRFPGAPFSTILKPLDGTRLRVFLQGAVEHPQAVLTDEDASEVDPRRSERDRLLQSLLFASFRLQQVNVERTNFLARALHDFRAPLTAVSGYCGLLVDQFLGPLNTRQTEVLHRMQQSLRRLSRLATVTFHLSLGQAQGTKPFMRLGDITECVNQAVYETMPLAEAKHLEVNVQVTQPSVPLRFDPDQIQEVLVNLLENACKYTPELGLVAVKGYPVLWTEPNDGDWPAGNDKVDAFRIDVLNTRIGIAPEHLNQIFERPASSSGSSDPSGTGFGLATCRMIMAAHHGEVFAESNAENTVFSMVLPSHEISNPSQPLRDAHVHTTPAAFSS